MKHTDPAKTWFKCQVKKQLQVCGLFLLFQQEKSFNFNLTIIFLSYYLKRFKKQKKI